jgi:hypothetical protein
VELGRLLVEVIELMLREQQLREQQQARSQQSERAPDRSICLQRARHEGTASSQARLASNRG